MHESEYNTNILTQHNNRETQMITLIKNNLLVLLGALIGGVAGHYEAVTVFKEFSQHHGTTTNELLGVLAGAGAGYLLKPKKSV